MRKNYGRKQKSEVNPPPSKSIGLFDHIKQIQTVRDPNYYDSLSPEDKKTFNIFMIIRGLSMNPDFIDSAAFLYKYSQIIPPAQFYKVFLGMYGRHKYKEFYRWIKAKKESGEDFGKKKKLIELLVQKYEISDKEAEDCLKTFYTDKTGKDQLADIVRGFGFSEEEVKEMI